MNQSADSFKDWMDARGLSAADVAKDLGTEEQTVRKWRSQGVPDRRRPHVERYMSEWVDPSAASTTEPETSILRIEFDDEELDLVSTAAGIVDTPIREFIRRAAVHQARVDAAKSTPAKVSPFPSKPDVILFELPFFGTVAAGQPGGPVDIADGTHPVPGEYDPATHYVLRVHGQSMEPEYPNGSFIVCRKLKTGEFATKGQDVIACDAAGAYFKRLLYTKDGKKGDSPRKAKPHLTSINPDYPEVVPVADCPIVAVVVSKA